MGRRGVDTETLVAAVTEPTRRQLLDLLLERGESTITALAHGLPITRQAVSKHLTVLDRVGLVTGRRTGRETRYSVNLERLDQATTSLGQLATEWDRRLARIKQIAEAAHSRTKKPA
jgi:ArsR family transcriptional regulator, cadmium/lead-responsive transcriptional repressor